MRPRWWTAWTVACALGCERSLPLPEAPNCFLTESHYEIAVANNAPVDLLIVIDTSPSMADEQAALERELPGLVRMLVTGERSDDRRDDYAALRDLHVAVVSADLGAGASDLVVGCSALGDDARPAQGAACGGGLPAFADYFVPRPTRHPLVPEPTRDAEEALLADIMCRVRLAESPCTVSQPFEATLRALARHPAFRPDDPAHALPFLQVLLISDGDDCSLREAGGGALTTTMGDASCFDRDSALQSVQRFVEGLRAMRPGDEQRVAVSAIVGLPPGFTHAPPPLTVDWSADQVREAFYRRILDDPAMQPRLAADGSLATVCESEHARATPSPRIVQAVQQLGLNGTLQSICEGDWSHALIPLLGVATGYRVGDAICTSDLPIAPDGRAACRMVWALPPPGRAPRGTPTSCSDLPYLEPLAERPIDAEGRTLCEVHQLRVEGEGDDRQLEAGGGWFYDQVPDLRSCTCPGGIRCGSVVFVPNVTPPSGVTVQLGCFETQYALPADGPLDELAERAGLFDACEPAEPRACARQLQDRAGGPERDGFDRRLLCHPGRRQCVLPCSDGSCPTGWSCGPDQICEPGECRVPG